MADSSLVDAEAWQVNPLIQHTKDDTLYAAVCAVKAIARLHSDRADWQQLSNSGDTCSGPDALLEDEARGIAFLCECVGAALRYEIDGRVRDAR